SISDGKRFFGDAAECEHEIERIACEVRKLLDLATRHGSADDGACRIDRRKVLFCDLDGGGRGNIRGRECKVESDVLTGHCLEITSLVRSKTSRRSLK